MAKTIMITNSVYDKLKKMKNDRSFSETISDLIEASEKKTGAGLRDCLGLLPPDDTEYDEILKESRKQFRKWTKKSA